MKSVFPWRRWLGGVLWGVGFALNVWIFGPPVVRAQAGTAEQLPVAARQPVIRRLDRQKDGKDLQRIWHHRKKLPEPYYRQINFGWARADIRGLRKKEYFAHSRIQSTEGFPKGVARRLGSMSFSPEKGQGRFRTLMVDYHGNTNSPLTIPRWFDTEYKILEDIAARLTNTAAIGQIRLYTNLEPCLSCRGVMEQFLAIYSNVEMTVFYEWPP